MKLRGAVVGVGYLHSQKYKALCSSTFAGKIEFVGVCDLNAEQSQKVAQTLEVQSFKDPKELLGKIELVSIATVTQSHYEVAKMFLENGVHVNVEKPIAATVDQAQKLITLAKSKGLVLTVGHSERFNPAYRFLQNQNHKPVFMDLQRHSPYKSRGADVSVVHDLMIHDLDLALNLDSTEVKVNRAQGGRVLSPTLDWARCELQFASGAQAHISVSRLAAQMTRTLKLVTSQGVSEVNLQTGDLAVSRVEGREVVVATQSFGKSDNLLQETENFFHSVLGDSLPMISGAQGLRALQLCEDVVQMCVSP